MANEKKQADQAIAAEQKLQIGSETREGDKAGELAESKLENVSGGAAVDYF